MMRVITGSARGRRLETLPGEDVTRPTTESVKEALFSMIQFDIEGRRVLDLFAGSGQLGIEALSRGARSCTFVENNRGAKQVVERNLAHCRLEEQANVVFSDAVSFLNRSGTYDLVLLDPPYGKGILQRVLAALVPRLSDDAMVVCESGRQNQDRPVSSRKGLGRMKTAICPGSFDPVTLGHLDIIERAAGLFDQVTVLVMQNSAKQDGLFTVEERCRLIRRCLHAENIQIDTYDGLLVDYAKQTGAAAVVKGLRALSDFEYEFQQALTNKSLCPQLETVFLTAKGENMFLSSSMVKEVCRLDGDISALCPKKF